MPGPSQEAADFVVLTGSKGRLPPGLALALNFSSGLSVLLGGLITLATRVNSASVGLLLAFGGGVYLHVACTEAMPTVYANTPKVSDRFLCLLLFVTGTVLISLVLLDHEHCSLNPSCGPVDPNDPHAGHGH